MKMPFPESMKEAEAIDHAFEIVNAGRTYATRYTTQYMVRNGWGRLSIIWEITPEWEWLDNTGKTEFMKHYWKHRLGVVPCYKNEQ